MLRFDQLEKNEFFREPCKNMKYVLPSTTLSIRPCKRAFSDYRGHESARDVQSSSLKQHTSAYFTQGLLWRSQPPTTNIADENWIAYL